MKSGSNKQKRKEAEPPAGVTIYRVPKIMSVKCEIYRDSMQNYKKYGIPKAQLVLPKFRNGAKVDKDGRTIRGTGRMIFNWFTWEKDGKDIPKIHPAQKPVVVLKRLIEIFTDPGDVVIDPCCGSGSTLRAAAEMERSTFGFEIDRNFFQRAKNEMLVFERDNQMSIEDYPGGDAMNQMNIFDVIREPVKITKPIRLIELFAGYGSQAMALKRIGAKFEHYRVVEFDKYAIASYNAVHGTYFPTMDITQVHADDLHICDTDKYCYFMTYSFPCTDLSLAGKQAGMKKGSGTRSGLLWEVERILCEIKESGEELPQILFMENVPQVHSADNMPDFRKWIDFLTGLGYVSYWQDLNAKNYGVAQNRERCFMFSFLGDYNYHFPELIPLKRKLKDYLEDNVEEKYYINNEKAQKLIQTLIDNGTLQKHNSESRAEQSRAEQSRADLR